MRFYSLSVVLACVCAGAAGAGPAAPLGGAAIPPEERFLPPPEMPGFAALGKSLLDAVSRAAADGKSPDDVLEDPGALRAVLAWDAIRTAGAEHLDALAAKSPKYARFLRAFLDDTEWMTLYAGAGLVPSGTGTGMRVLADIWARDRRSPDFRSFLCLSTGIAAAWGAGPYSGGLQYGETLPPGAGRTDPVWRYFFFKASRRDGRLYKGFDRLRPWEIRFVAGNHWSDASLAWLQSRVNVHPDLWGGACWLAPYCGMSEFGDTIQGPLYYAECPREMSEAERAYVHGGVCGALSTTGSTAASARGIPSYTCGQPGHCAYAFRLKRGEWRGGFGGPDGSPHNWIFPGRAPAMPRLTEAAFQDDRQVDRFARLLAAARAFEAAGKKGLMKRAWREILRDMPLQYHAQLEFQECAKRNGLMTDAKKWEAYARLLTKAYEGHGFALMEVLKPVEPLLLAGKTPAQKTEWLLELQKALCRTPPSWSNKMEDTLKRTPQAVGSDRDDRARFLSGLLTLHQNEGNDQTFGQALEWVVKTTLEKGDDALFARAIDAISDAAPDAGGKGRKKNLRAAYGKAILAAEKARSPAACRALAERARAAGVDDGYDPKKKLALPPGETLVSDKGFLRISSTSNWDRPCAHEKVLRDADGAFHTAAEERPHAIVQLPKAEKLSSILIVKNSGNEWRNKHLSVYRSTDGATWFPVAENRDTPPVWRIPLSPAADARWIKVVQNTEGGKEVFHLRNILLFTK